MKRIYFSFVFALLIIILFPYFVFSERGIKVQSRRLALVIGNGAYKSSPLRNPVNDAYDMAKALRKMGFEVIHKENANQRDIEEAIHDFGRKLRLGGVGLFYFAGHGIQVKGRNYLIPIGARIKSESDVKFEAVDAGRILGKMEDAENELNIVMLDACRDNPYSRSFRTSTRGLARMDAPTGSFIAYATAPGSVAADGSGRNGVFTGSLLKNMVIPGVKIEDVLKRVRNEVIQATNHKQVPWQSSSLRGDFYFVIEGKITVSKVPPTKDSTELEKERARLERERQELERLKMEIERKKLEAERKRLEAEKKNLEMAKLPPEKEISRPASTSEVTGRDGTFIAYASGVVRDTKTGLEWVAGPDRDMTWDEARDWVKGLSIDGGGWRMPRLKELKILYQKDAGSRNMTPLLKTTGWYVWSIRMGNYRISGTLLTQKRGGSFSFRNFASGEAWYSSNKSGNMRGFAVRSRR